MLNAVGLQNPGIDAVIAQEIPNMARLFQGPLVANVGGFSLAEYADNCAKLDACENVGILEVNISCPNVHAGGKNFGCDPHAAAEVTRAVKAVTKKPVFMKLTPNVTDITEIARACADAGADGICLINTLLGMRIDLKSNRPLLANRTGGLSGPAVFPVAVRMVWDVYEAVQAAHHRLRRRLLRRGRVRDDAGGCQRRGDRRRQPAGPLRLQEPSSRHLPRRLRAAGRCPHRRTHRRRPPLIPSKSLNFKRKDLFAMSAKDVIIALDFPTREETLTFLDQFPAGEKPFVKIGMELFYAEGPQVVRDIKARGHKIFLDLKLHDIPNTVKRAMAVLSRLDVDMVNLHAAGDL